MRKFLVIGCLLGLLGCSETIDFQVSQRNPDQLVVDGFFTTTAEDNYIVLTQTTDFKSGDVPVSVTGASVILEHGGGTVVLTEVAVGVYEPSFGFHLDPETNYEFVVVTAAGEYRYATEIEPLTGIVDAGIEEVGDSLDIFLDLSRPNAGTGYLMVEIFQGEVIAPGDTVWEPILTGIDSSRVDIVEFPDGGVAGVDYRIENPGIGSDSLVCIDVHAFNEPLFEYFTALRQDLDGDIFGPQPSNPKPLFSNGAFGVVFNSSLSRVTLELGE